MKRARKARGLTAVQIAQSMGVSSQRIYAVEMYADCSAELVARYERALRDAERTRLRHWRLGEDLWRDHEATSQLETAGVSTLPAVSEARRVRGKPSA